MSEIKILYHTDGDYVPKELLDSAQGKLKKALDKIATAQIALGEKDYIWTDSLISDAIKELESV